MSSDDQQWGVPPVPPEREPATGRTPEPWAAGGPAAPQQPYQGQPLPGQPYPGPAHPGPYQSYPAPQKSTNGMAVASLVLGIVWLYWIGSILALIFGYIARRQIRENNQSGDGLAVAGIVLGWVGVAILAIVLVVVFAGLAASTSTA